MANEQPSSSSQANNVRSMQGSIIHISEGTGIISGDDNYRYSFNFADILSNHNQIFNGGRVDFRIEGEIAKQIIPIPGSTNILSTGGGPREKGKFVDFVFGSVIGWLTSSPIIIAAAWGSSFDSTIYFLLQISLLIGLSVYYQSNKRVIFSLGLITPFLTFLLLLLITMPY